MNIRDNLRQLINEAGYDFVRQLPYPHVDLFFWRPYDGTLNFGDYLSIVVVDHLLRHFGYTLSDEVPLQTRMFAIGSVLHSARNGNVIWGSGVNGRPGQDGLNRRVQHLDVRAVRGPRTREVLQRRGIAVPEVFGDPALLLPQLFPNRFRPTAKRPWVFVPNLHDLSLIDHTADTVVSPLGSWNRRIDAILEAELVLASSLHGIIVAEAFGVPARCVRLSGGESEFKYRDYYEGTGRFDVEFASSVDEGREMGGAAPLNFDHHALMGAFPIDLWTGRT